MRGLEILEEAGCNVRVLIMPEGKDPTSMSEITVLKSLKTL